MVYLIRGGRLHKIGKADDPIARLRELQIGCPIPLVLVATGEGGRGREAAIQIEFERFRKSGEWFGLSVANVQHAIALVEGRAAFRRPKAQQAEGKSAAMARHRSRRGTLTDR